MIVTTVTVFVKPQYIEEFTAASIENHNQSVKEPGNMRFDILQSNDDPTRFLLYEAYENEEASRAHKQTAHYLIWRDTLAPMMAKPREGIAHQVITPTSRLDW